MAFGQAAGPPASAKKIQELAGLLQARGFDSFREARHPFGLTQRQAGGKFTTAEADELLERLQGEVDDPQMSDAAAVESKPPARAASGVGSDRVAQRALRRQEDAVVGLLSEVMATELTNRGWCCIPPPEA